MPKISVIMPVYNGEKYLREAIDSILAQTYTDFEFIIIDDGSSDSSPEIVRGYDDPRIRFYQNEHNMGVAATLNRGLDLAAGEYIARMDADDISLPERFAKQVAYMDRHLKTAVCGTNAEIFFENGNTQKTSLPEKSKDIRSNLFISSPFVHPSVMMRKATLDKGDIRYETEFEGREDYRLWTRLFRLYELGNLNEALLRYRMHNNQVTQRSDGSKYRKHYMLKHTLLTECGIASSGREIESLCKISVGMELTEKAQVMDLKAIFAQIAEHMEFQKFPKLYHQIIVQQCKKERFSVSDYWKITVGFPLFRRIWYIMKGLKR